MKFGKVADPSLVDFTLPPTPPETYAVLGKNPNDDFEVFVGCAKWNKTDLKNFYPKGTKDELTYYSQQFNSIELNATYYSSPSKDQVQIWNDKTPESFKFFPKIPQSISHYSRLLNTNEKVLAFTDSLAFFEDKLGMIFLQMHENFKPKDFDRLQKFIEEFPKGFPLAVEVLKNWRENGLQKLYFFIHQNTEVESPLLATHFIKQLNDTFKLELPYPGKNDLSLF